MAVPATGLDMNRQQVAGVLVVLGVVGTLGVGSAVAGVGPAADLLGPQHELQDFAVSDPQCTDDFATNSSTAIETDGSDTVITHAQNISLADPGVTVGEPTLERVNGSTYRLSIPTEDSGGGAAQCVASARYNASMTLPVDDEPWTVIVEHDGERATTLFGDSNSSGASGSASAGGSVAE